MTKHKKSTAVTTAVARAPSPPPAPQDNLQKIIADVFKVPIDSVAIVMIHMSAATEREPHIKALEEAIGCPLTILPASDGRALVKSGHPINCGMENRYVRTPGEVGCLVSHIRAAHEALQRGKKYLMIFEDDCMPSSTFTLKGLRAWFEETVAFFDTFSWKGSRDLILPSTGGCYTNLPLTPTLKGTNRFNCTHAMLLGRSMMERMINSYRLLLKKDRIIPIDGLLGLLLFYEKEWAVTPYKDEAFFQQDKTLPSYTTLLAPAHAEPEEEKNTASE